MGPLVSIHNQNPRFFSKLGVLLYFYLQLLEEEGVGCKVLICAYLSERWTVLSGFVHDWK